MLVFIFCQLALTYAEHAFVFLGPTGDNALRENGVWQGLFEAYSGGVFEEAEGVHIFAAMNTPHTEKELQSDILASLNPLYETLQKVGDWKCRVPNGECSPQQFLTTVSNNIHDGRDACAQAATMVSDLEGYESISVYLSIPPSSYGDWATCVVKYWGKDDPSRLHLAAEKPFGTDLENAQSLYQSMSSSGLPESNIHLVDHWLSFFMVKNMQTWRSVVGRALNVNYDYDTFDRIVVTQNEERGLEGRGGFFDGVGQVRDMVQSHLLQVLGTALMTTGCWSPSEAKLNVFNRTEVQGCRLAQYDGFLLEPKLTYHPSFADSTFSAVELLVSTVDWSEVPMLITTGKDMGELVYTVEFHQKNGEGVVTYQIGKEETGVAGVKIANWPLKDSSPFPAPVGGFDSTATVKMFPSVDAAGNGYLVRYDDPNMYFPKPYATMISALLRQDYSTAFVTFAECEVSWRIVASKSPSLCLDPRPEDVRVYTPPGGADPCTTVGPDKVCWESRSVLELYDDVFACNAANDIKYANISFYQSKCH